MSDLFQRVEKCIEKYKCECPNLEVYEAQGCTDCLNTGYIFDNEEIYLLMEASELAQKLQKENEELRKEYNKTLNSLSECEDKRCKVIEEKKEMRLEVERMRVRLKKEEKIVDLVLQNKKLRGVLEQYANPDWWKFCPNEYNFTLLPNEDIEFITIDKGDYSIRGEHGGKLARKTLREIDEKN